MKLRKTLLSFACAIMVALSFTACGDDWGRQDDPAGGQIYPSKTTVATYDFEYSEEKPEYSDMISHDESCEVTNDETLASNVLHINGKGGAKIANPFNGVKLQNGAAITFAVKIDAAVAEDGTVADVDLTRPLISFGSDEKDAAGNDISAHFYITANGQVVYNKPTQLQSLNLNENDPASVKTGILSPNEWHFVALQLSTEGYQLYVDGKKSLSGYQTSSSATSFKYKTLVDSINSLPYLYIGGDSKLTAEETNTVSIDNVTLIRNMMEEKDWNKTIGGNGGGDEENTDSPIAPVYFNPLNGGDIVGGGQFKYVGGTWGTVFSNATGGRRANYLKLPSDVLSHSSATKEISIGFWVNRGNEKNSNDYMWAPLFMAYGAAPVNGANTLPMFACQYRGVLQINNNGYCDFTDAQNDNKANTLYHGDKDWLADGDWHYYTVTMTETQAIVYIDGNVANSWTVSGSGDNNVISGIFTNGADLKYICLGGNQAWDWGDNDPGFWFDDFAVYDKALTPGQIRRIMNLKKDPVYFNSFENGAGDCSVVGGGSFIDAGKTAFGKVFSNVGGALRSNYLLLPSDALSHSTVSQATSISFWVNRGNETNSDAYLWAPMFMAYGAAPANGENGMPMFACQYRGLLQINNNGWCDFTDVQNDNGACKLWHGNDDWLADGEWHLYTAVLTPTTAKVYIDGKIANSWTVSGSGDGNVIAGLFTNGADLKYICLGGNQAWSWGDNDPGFWFDDMAIYDCELSEGDILQIYSMKKGK